jgi:hypothetical protein
MTKVLLGLEPVMLRLGFGRTGFLFFAFFGDAFAIRSLVLVVCG